MEERLPAEREECCEGEKYTASDIVQVAVMDSVGNQFVSEDMLFDGEWVNYPWGDFEITHWMPLHEPPKEGRMMDVSQIQLKPCPFCGSHVSMRCYPNCVVIRCDNSYMNGAGSFTSWKNGDTDERSAARLTNAWNNRKAAENEG